MDSGAAIVETPHNIEDICGLQPVPGGWGDLTSPMRWHQHRVAADRAAHRKAVGLALSADGARRFLDIGNLNAADFPW
jgi:hypothetical protein